MKPLIISSDASPRFFEIMAQGLYGEIAQIERHIFPDGESYIRVSNDCTQRDAIIITNLHQPNAKILSLIFLCETRRKFGIRSSMLL